MGTTSVDSPHRKLAAILAADMVGYSRLMEQDEAGTVARLKSDRNELIDPAISARGGHIVHLAGDGVLVEFPSVIEATQCAIDIQRAMPARNRARDGEEPIEYRIGVNLGDIIVEEDDIHGEGINLAARLESLAEPGAILLTEEAARHVEGKVSAAIEFAEERTVKNIERPVRIWRVLLDETPQSPTRKRRAAKSRSPWVIGAGALLIAGIIVAVFWAPHFAPNPENPPAAHSTTASTEKPSLAVLPFDNLSNDPDQEYFVDGITEDMITDLSTLGRLSVIARNSTFAYKGRPMDVRQIGAELGAEYILEGSIRKVGDRIRVNAQLIDAATATHLWAERFDEQMTDVFAVQDRVIRRIVEALSVTLSPAEEESLSRSYTVNPEAYDEFLKGQDAVFQFSIDRLEEARTSFRRAIELDPEFARAYSALSATYTIEVQQGVADDTRRTLQQAIDLARTAIAIGSELPQAYFVLGYAYVFTFQHERAVESLDRAIELAPSYADAYMLLAFIFIHMGRNDEAFPLIEEGMRLNPNYPAEYLGILAHAYYWAGNFDESAKLSEIVVDRSPTYLLMRADYINSLRRAGRLDEAEWQVEELLTLNPDFSVSKWISERPYADPAMAEQRAEDLRRVGLPE